MDPRVEPLEVTPKKILGFCLAKLPAQVGSYLPLTARHRAKAPPDSDQPARALDINGLLDLVTRRGKGNAASPRRDMHMNVLDWACDGDEWPQRRLQVEPVG